MRDSLGESRIPTSTINAVVNRRRLHRVVAAALLVWIALDLAAIHTCALEAAVDPPGPSSSAPSFRAPAPPAHPHAVPHPDHCFCHSLSVGPGRAARLASPFSTTARLADTAPGRFRWTTADLDHPPKTFA